jgi:hypothetical protein
VQGSQGHKGGHCLVGWSQCIARPGSPWKSVILTISSLTAHAWAEMSIQVHTIQAMFFVSVISVMGDGAKSEENCLRSSCKFTSLQSSHSF